MSWSAEPGSRPALRGMSGFQRFPAFRRPENDEAPRGGGRGALVWVRPRPAWPIARVLAQAGQGVPSFRYRAGRGALTVAPPGDRLPPMTKN